MNAIVKQLGFSHLMPLHKARCIVMRESTVHCFDLVHVNHCDDNIVNDVSQNSSSRKNISTRHACHVVMKALRDNVDPYDYDCDSDTDDDDDDDADDYSNSSLIMEEDTSCSSSESSVSDDEEVSSQPDHRMVRFCAPLVTASYVRPVTTIEEKYELYYTEREYREFRRNYVSHTRSQQQRIDRLQQQQQHSTSANKINITRKPSVVQFHVDVITEIYTTPTIDNPTELYYSRTELQGFLDDFVASLVKGV